jgi:uncharacterized protein YwgA
MDRLQRAAILTELMDQLRASGSWCGETHVQKAVYFLQEVLGVPTGFEYILYKHGPYSFDLTADLTALRADFLMEFNHRSPGYGPGLVPTPTSVELRARYQRTLANHSRQIKFIAMSFGARGVSDLEKLATALFVTRELRDTAEVSKRASRIHELKPHVSEAEALVALQEFERIVIEAKSLAPQVTHA